MKTTFSKNASKSFVSCTKGLSFFVLAIFLFNSCKKEILISDKNELLKAQNGTVNINAISYSEFLKKVDISKHREINAIFDAKGNAKIQTDVASETPALELQTGGIREIVAGGTKSYVFPVAPSSRYATTFQNLTIHVAGDTVKTFVTTYRPSADWIKKWREKSAGLFTGEVGYHLVEASNTTGVAGSGGVVMNSGGNCWSWQEYYLQPYACDGPPYHWPGDVDCPYWQKAGTAYYAIETVTRETCYNSSQEGGGSGGGSGTGGGEDQGPPGGVTTPVPPTGYDPCTMGLNSPGSQEAGATPCEGGGNANVSAAQQLINRLGITDPLQISLLNANTSLVSSVQSYLASNSNSLESEDFARWTVAYLTVNPNTWTAFNDLFFSGPKDLIFEGVTTESITTQAYLQTDYNLAGVTTYFTESEFENLINNLSNDFNEDPIQLYLIACYKNSKLLNSSLYSTPNSQKIGDYTVTPHYNSQGTLVFYSAWRSSSLGIEYLIKANALNDFKNNHTFYRACANLFYVNGRPSHSQIQMGAGDYWKGLLTSYQEAFSNPYYYVYLAHAFIGTATNLKTVPNTNQPIKFTSSTIRNTKDVSITIENMSIAEYRNAIGQKYNTTWQSLGDGKFRLEVGQNRYMSYPSATSTGKPTIEYFRNGNSIGKFRFHN